MHCAKTGGTTAMNYMSSMKSVVLTQAGTVWGLVTDRAGKVQGILLSTPAGPILIACQGVTNEVGKKGKEMVRNGVDMVQVMMRGSKALMKVSVLVADGVLRGTLKYVKNQSSITLDQVIKRSSLVVNRGVNATRKAVGNTTQASLTTLALLRNTVQTVVISMANMGGSVGKQGVTMVRNVWFVNGRILLGLLTTTQKYIPGTKHLLKLGSVFGVPFIEIPAAGHHGTEQKHPDKDKEQPLPDTAASSHQGTKHRSSETYAAKTTSSRHQQDKSHILEVCSDYVFP